MKSKVVNAIGSISLVASIAMYEIGTNSSHLSELADFYWIPLPLGISCLIAGYRLKQKEKKDSWKS